MKQVTYRIYCPNCKKTFDCSEQLNIWRDDLFEAIDKIIKEKKGERR